MSRKVYTYEVVTSNGAGIHTKGYRKCSEARARMERVAAQWSIPGEVFEIQRVEHVGSGDSRRYQVRQRSRWVQWDPHRDHTVRSPDWQATSTGRRS